MSGDAAAEAGSSGGGLSPWERRLVLWGCRLLRWGALAYAAYLVLLPLVLFPFIGERNLTLAFFLYLPPAIWLVPVPLFLALLVWRMRRVAGALLLASLIYVWLGMGFELAGGASPGAASESLRILTFNRGQHSNESLQPFKNATAPDVVVFQEAARRAGNYQRAEGYSEFPHVVGLGEFVILSKFPILQSELVEPAVSLRKPRERPRNRPVDPEAVAARHVLQMGSRQIVLYNVHFLTPRDTLYAYRRGAFLWGVLGVPFTPLASKRRAYQEYWDNRIAQAEGLRARIEAESMPVVVAGDFNAPAGGKVHRIFASVLEDAHRKAGRGFGYTFPGATRNPLSLFGPWMRIDYVFAGEGWKAVRCKVEKGRRSQHRALFAELKLPGAN